MWKVDQLIVNVDFPFKPEKTLKRFSWEKRKKKKSNQVAQWDFFSLKQTKNVTDRLFFNDYVWFFFFFFVTSARC